MNTRLNQTETELAHALEGMQPRPTGRFYARMRTSPWMQAQPDAWVKEPPRRLLVPAALTLAVLLLLGTLFVTAPVQAWTQELLSLFRRQPTDVHVHATAVPTMVFPSLAAAQAEIDHSLWGPAALPSGYTLDEIVYRPASQETHFVYRYSASHLLHFTQRPLHAEEVAASLGIGASAAVETVAVGGTLGEYVEGAWFGNTPGDPLTWRSGESVRALRWQQMDKLFTLTATGALVEAGALDRLDLLSLAETLVAVDAEQAPMPTPALVAEAVHDEPLFFPRLPTDQKTVIQPDPTDPNPYAQTSGLSLEAASTLAGYAVHTPAYAPEGFHRVEVAYIPDEMSVYQVYQLGEDREKIVILGQHPTRAALPSSLEIGANAVVQEVSVNGQHAELVQGSWVSESHEVPAPGAEMLMVWDPEIAYFQLVWEGEGTVYSLRHGGSPMWRLDPDVLIEMARSLP